MPRLLNGQAIGGIGNAGCFLNGKRIEELGYGGSPGWVNKYEIAAQSEKPLGAEVVVTYDLGLKKPIILQPVGPADVVKAGAGVIANCLRSGLFRTYIHNDLGVSSYDNFVPLDVDRVTGSVIMIHAASGSNIYVVNRGSSSIDRIINVGPILSARSVGGLLIWEYPDHSLGTPDLKLNYVKPAGQPILVDTKDGIWLIYHFDKLYATPYNDSTHGFVVEGETTNPDAEVFNGYLRIAFSRDAGDQSVEFRDYDTFNPPLIPVVPPPTQTRNLYIYETLVGKK